MMPFGPPRVGDERHAPGAAPQVETHIVGVAVGRHHLGREEDRPYDPVGMQVDRHELGSAVGGAGEQRASGVEDPQPVDRVDDDALHRLEVPGQVGGVLPVHLGVGVGHRLATAQFGDGERDVVTPAGKVDEGTTVARDGDTGRHRVPETGDDGVAPAGRTGGKGRLGELGGRQRHGGRAEERTSFHASSPDDRVASRRPISAWGRVQWALPACPWGYGSGCPGGRSRPGVWSFRRRGRPVAGSRRRGRRAGSGCGRLRIRGVGRAGSGWPCLVAGIARV